MSIEPQGVPKPDRTWIYVGLSFVVLWTLYLAFFGPRSPAGRAPRLDTPGAAGPVDYGWRLLDLEDKPVEFSRFKGKTLFLNVWATWCGPCVRELPSIARLAADPRLKGVEFVCVSTDESADPVRRFLSGKDWPLKVFRATDLPPVFATEGIPATFLIAPDGRVAAAEIGAAVWDDPGVVAFLENLSKREGSADPVKAGGVP